MKKLFVCFLLGLLCIAMAHAEGIAEKAAEGNEKAEMSYAFGMILAADFVGSGMEFNYNSLARGFRETLEGQDTRLSMEDAMMIAQIAYYAAMEKQAEANIQQEVDFFELNGQRETIVTTESGLQYEVLTEGSGLSPALDDFVLINYQGTLIDGTVFDSSYERGEPEEIPLQGVIPGFSEGVLLMREGGKSRFYIPSSLAYGQRSIGGIPPNSLLIFEVELLEVVEASQDSFDFFYYDYDEDVEHDFDYGYDYNEWDDE